MQPPSASSLPGGLRCREAASSAAASGALEHHTACRWPCLASWLPWRYKTGNHLTMSYNNRSKRLPIIRCSTILRQTILIASGALCYIFFFRNDSLDDQNRISKYADITRQVPCSPIELFICKQMNSNTFSLGKYPPLSDLLWKFYHVQFGGPAFFWPYDSVVAAEMLGESRIFESESAHVAEGLGGHLFCKKERKKSSLHAKQHIFHTSFLHLYVIKLGSFREISCIYLLERYRSH